MESSEEFFKEKLIQCEIPERMHESLIMYIMHGQPVGRFLDAILSNNLYQAVSRADNENQPILHKYVKFLVNYAPMGCWRSYENIVEWIKTKGLDNEK